MSASLLVHALISTTGVPRPAYYTFFKYLGRKAP